MKYFHLFGILATALALAVFTGCGNQQGGPPKGGDTAKGGDTPTKKGGEPDHDDEGPGPHGGTVFHFGKWHAEFTVDHKAKEATLYILTYQNKPAAISVEKPLLSIKSPQFQVELKAVPQEGDSSGNSSRFVGTHDNFGKEQEFEGTLSGVANGKPYAGDFKEQEHKDHKKKKD